MPPATVEQLALLGPYLEGKADELGEISMFCPMHNDSQPSASANVNRGVWFCQAGCGGGSLRQLCDASDTWVRVVGRVGVRKTPTRSTSLQPLPTARQVASWHQNLMSNGDIHRWLRTKRGITANTAKRAHIGLNGHVKIPVYDEDRNLVNVRTYDPDPVGRRRKIWSIKGRGIPHLYPIGVLANASPGDKVMIVEGEWDALLLLQNGILAVTRTASATSLWREEWTDWFDDLEGYLCHDADSAGKAGDGIVANGIGGVVRGLWQCELPYRRKLKGGKDVTDLVLERGIQEVHHMMAKAERIG